MFVNYYFLLPINTQMRSSRGDIKANLGYQDYYGDLDTGVLYGGTS